MGDIVVTVILKDIGNIHLSVLPPDGKVRVSAPLQTKPEAIRLFIISKIGWIKKQRKKLITQTRETPREYLERESHYLWGKRYLLSITEKDEPAKIEIKHNRIFLQVRPGSDITKMREVMEAWYRDEIRSVLPQLLDKWKPIIGKKANQIYVQHMKTKWGGCSPETGNIRLNTELAKKPQECLEYILVHELVHLKEPKHNDRFQKLMDTYLPHWEHVKSQLNQSPLTHESWFY